MLVARTSPRGLSLSALSFGAGYVVRRLARFTGGGFLDDVAAFLVDLSGLLGGMRDRAAQVTALLRRPEVGFVIVTGPNPRAIDEALELHERLVQSGLSPAAFVINKVHPLAPVAASVPEIAARLRRLTSGPVVEAQAQALAASLLQAHEQLQVLARADAAEVQRLMAGAGLGVLTLQVPLFNEDIFDVAGLLRLAERLS